MVVMAVNAYGKETNPYDSHRLRILPQSAVLVNPFSKIYFNNSYKYKYVSLYRGSEGGKTKFESFVAFLPHFVYNQRVKNVKGVDLCALCVNMRMQR